MPNREVVIGYSILCNGVTKDKLKPLSSPAHAILTIYKDGGRDVGCEMLTVETGVCNAGILENKTRCIQLYPASASETARIVGIEEDKEFDSYGEAVSYLLTRFGIKQNAHAKDIVVGRILSRTPQ
jgi:hypothetical protein